jgi:hypothetical protein
MAAPISRDVLIISHVRVADLDGLSKLHLFDNVEV